MTADPTTPAPRAAPPAPPARSRGRLEPWQDPAAQPYVRVAGLTKRFGGVLAVDRIDLNIYPGEFFALLGGSGSGKTTLLRMLAGFETPNAGRLYVDGKDITDLAPYDRPVNMMFQSYALFPHMSVERNVGFGLAQDGVPKGERRERVEEALALVQLSDLARRKPHQLSGGQRQRVALARSLVKRPKVLLLDEPLAALDKKLREQTQFELVNIQEQVGITFIVVTHDQEEAMTMATRLAIMDKGRLTQTGPPTEVYEFPQSRFVAEFLGSVNLVEGNVVADHADHVVIRSERMLAPLVIDHSVQVRAGARVTVAIRPEKMTLTRLGADADASPPAEENCAVGTVVELAYLGSLAIVHVALDGGQRIRVTVPITSRVAELPVTWDDRVAVTWRRGGGVLVGD